MASAGFLIYSAVVPLVKMFLTILFGFILARKDQFPPDASRGASYLTLNVTLPALIFSSIVPAFSPYNISAIGPLALVAVLYVLISFVFGFIIREVCYVPRNFWQGIIVATGLSNWGNLPIAVVLSVTQQSPFNPSTDPNLGVSYIAVFIVVYQLFFWVGGLAHSLSWDYLPGIPQGEEAELRVPWREKPFGRWITKMFSGVRRPADPRQEVEENYMEDEKLNFQLAMPVAEERGGDGGSIQQETVDQESDKRTTRLSVSSVHSSASETILSTFRDQGDLPVEQRPAESVHIRASTTYLTSFLPSAMVWLCRAIISMVMTPVNLAIIVAIPISVVQPLKALFVDTSAFGGPSWKAPDGNPPLTLILDTASFVGGLTVPLALILLGASFARSRVPRPISRLPIPAMLSVCVAKQVILPVIGVFVVQAMVGAGLIPKASKAELFVAMFLSGTPTAVNQIIVSGLYSPTGETDTLSAFLLVQYIFMFFSSAALTAVALLLI